MKQAGRGFAAALCAVVLLLAGCASKPTRAPVEDRSTPARSTPAPAAAPAAPAEAAQPLPGAENAGKPGYYTVKPGDTLVRIALDNGQNWRDIARWNGLENPNVIEVGQVLRVVPPVAPIAPATPIAAAPAPGSAATRPVAPPGRVEARPLDAKPAAPAGSGAVAAAPATAPATAPTSAPATATSTPAATPPPTADRGTSSPAAPDSGSAGAAPPEDEIAWAWPASGPVLVAFDEGRNKGLTIGGKQGDPVLAAADGRVVYAGSSLRGYGNLVIVKHNNTYLSAYAHNQVLLVKEDQAVRRGQKIAEMGSTDAERVQLHFEIRRQGKPVDPSKMLPPR